MPQGLTDPAAIAERREDVDLLQSQAVMRASRGEYEEAIAIFRRIVEIDELWDPYFTSAYRDGSTGENR